MIWVMVTAQTSLGTTDLNLCFIFQITDLIVAKSKFIPYV